MATNKEKTMNVKEMLESAIAAHLAEILGTGKQGEPAADKSKARYAIVRSRDQGVMCGYVERIDGRRVTLSQARQIWRYDSTFVLPDIAEHGMRDPSKAMLSKAMSEPCDMLEACGVLYCTDVAAEKLRSIPPTVKP